MCLMVYLGIDRALPGFSDVPMGGIGLDPDMPVRPRALAAKREVYRVADRVPTGWNCSCVFIDQVMPWEMEKGDDPDDPDTPVRAAAYDGLARIVRAALEVDGAPMLFSCWAGDEGREPEHVRRLSPDAIRPARYLFDEIGEQGSAGNPPILIRLHAGET